jgi:hypothetical protein
MDGAFYFPKIIAAYVEVYGSGIWYGRKSNLSAYACREFLHGSAATTNPNVKAIKQLNSCTLLV